MVTSGRTELEVDEDVDFGFTWGENGEFTFIRRPDGAVKKVDENLIPLLTRIAKGDTEILYELSDAERQFLSKLEETGFVYDGPIYRVTFDTRSLMSRFILTCLLVAVAGIAIVQSGLFFFDWVLRVDGMPFWYLFVFLLVGGIVIALHELGHYAAMRTYAPSSFRLGLVNGMMPAVLTDVTESWMLPRSVRIWITLAGPVAQIAAALPFTLAFLLVFPESPLLALIVFGLNFGALYILNPLNHGDGYLFFADLFGVRGLKERGLQAFRRRELNRSSIYVAVSYAYGVVQIGVSFVVLYVILGSLHYPIFLVTLILVFNRLGSEKVLDGREHDPEWVVKVNRTIDEESTVLRWYLSDLVLEKAEDVDTPYLSE